MGYNAPDRPRDVDLRRRLRERATRSERFAWSLLRRRQVLGYRFRRQHTTCGFVVDFWCPELRLAIEIDGGSHIGRAEQDAARDARLGDQGIAVARIRVGHVSAEVLECIVRARAAELSARD